MPAQTEPVRYVIDASVVTKWHLQDEDDSAVADALLTDFREGRVVLLAPNHLRYEVASVITNAVRTDRVTRHQARQAITDFLVWHIGTIGNDGLILSAYD